MIAIHTISSSIQHLLYQRFKVINAKVPYPGSPYKANDIITLSNYLEDKEYYVDTCGNDISFFKSCPHIFKPLLWWEERAIDELPQYIFFQAGYLKGKVKVINWRLPEPGSIINRNLLFDFPDGSLGFEDDLFEFKATPSTE